MATAQPITTAQAQITTATVEIRTLTVSGKRMSIAVFRQLPVRHLLWVAVAEGVTTEPGREEDAWTVLREPIALWGWVNHHPPDCAPGGYAHLHLVGVHNGVLCRATVREYPTSDQGMPSPDTAYNNQYADAIASTATRQRLIQEWRTWYLRFAALPQLYIAT